MESKEKLKKYLIIFGVTITIGSLIFIGFKIYWGDPQSGENDKKPGGPKSCGKNKSFGDKNKFFGDERTKEVNTNTLKEEKTKKVLKKDSVHKSLNNSEISVVKVFHCENPNDKNIIKEKELIKNSGNFQNNKKEISLNTTLLNSKNTDKKILNPKTPSIKTTEEKKITKSLNEVSNFEKIEILDLKSEEEEFFSTLSELPVVNENLETSKSFLCKSKDYLYSWTSYFSWRKDTENTEKEKTDN